jgi:hypothetical protein
MQISTANIANHSLKKVNKMLLHFLDATSLLRRSSVLKLKALLRGLQLLRKKERKIDRRKVTPVGVIMGASVKSSTSH